MTRSFIAIVSAIFAATSLFASAAQACISCEYVPPVVNTPVYSHGGYHHAKKSVYRAAKAHQVRKAKRQFVKAEPRIKELKAAAVAPETKAVKKDAVNQNSSIAVAKTDLEPAANDAPEATGSTDADTEVQVGCKKFFPSVGMTLSVPCN